MSETGIVKSCIQYLRLRGIYAWRQNTAGVFNQKTGGYFFNGTRGVADILGILPQETEHGLQGILLCVECKTAKGVVSDSQKAFLTEIEQRGGLALVVRSVDELEAKLRDYPFKAF